jgi:hypothetical protein
MWIFIFIATAFGFGFLGNLLDANQLDPANMAIQLSICLLSILGFLFFRNQKARERDFFQWLQTNAQMVRLGGARYKDFLITPNTELKRFTSVVSLLFVTIRIRTRPFFPQESVQTGAAFFSSGTSLLFGWWGLPWGPVYTSQSLFTNLRGGERMTVGDLLADPAKPNIGIQK